MMSLFDMVDMNTLLVQSYQDQLSSYHKQHVSIAAYW